MGLNLPCVLLTEKAMLKKAFFISTALGTLGLLYFLAANDQQEVKQSTILKSLNLNEIQYQATREKEAISKCISNEFGINLNVIRSIVELTEQAAKKYQTDHLLILAIIGIESRFHPLLQSEAGALGLMQIMPNIHSAKLEPHGGRDAALDPRVNIDLGTSILTTFINRTGTIENGLAKYVGAGNNTNHIYVKQVLDAYKNNQSCVDSGKLITQTPKPS